MRECGARSNSWYYNNQERRFCEWGSAVLQKNEEVLRNLLATLLEMDEADIVSCHIENPIELGKEIEGKD